MGGPNVQADIELKTSKSIQPCTTISVTDGSSHVSNASNPPSNPPSSSLFKRTKVFGKTNHANSYYGGKEIYIGEETLLKQQKEKKKRKRSKTVILHDFGRGVASNYGMTIEYYSDTTLWKYTILQSILWGMMYFAVAWVGLQFIVADFSSFWPPNGIYVSAMLCISPRGRRITPFTMIISIFVVNVAWGRTAIQSLGFVGVNTFECLLASSLMRGFARALSGKSRLNLLHRSDLASIFLAIFIGCFISANLGTVMSRGQLDPSRSYGSTYIKWLGRNTVGLALIVPLSLSIPPFRVRRLHYTVYNWLRLNPCELLRASIMFISLIFVPALCAWVVSGTTLSSVVGLYVSCPLILYSGAIYGAFGATSSVLLVSLTIVTTLLLFTRYDVHPLLVQLSSFSVQGQFIWMQLLTLLLILMSLIFVLVLTERDRARALIERKVQARTEALTEALHEIEIARARAETADADKAVFFSFLCHELRNPLHVVSNMAGFLEEKLREQELSQVRAIKLSSGYMLALVSDVLDMGRFEAGRVVLEDISVDIYDLFQNNFACAEGLVKGHSISLETHIDPALPQYLATDPTRLQQVLNNLVSNAFKFTKKGGKIKIEVQVVEQFSQRATKLPKPRQSEPNERSSGVLSPLTIRRPAPSPAELHVRMGDSIREDSPKSAASPALNSSSEENGNSSDGESEWVMVQISVSDTGIGIAPEIVDKIFRPYAQATISTVREYGGSGLGLAITNQIVHLMKGKLTVDSEVGKGSTFSFTIPMLITDEMAPVMGYNVTTENHVMQSLYTQSLASNPTSPATVHEARDHSSNNNLRSLQTEDSWALSSTMSLPSFAFLTSFREMSTNTSRRSANYETANLINNTSKESTSVIDTSSVTLDHVNVNVAETTLSTKTNNNDNNSNNNKDTDSNNNNNTTTEATANEATNNTHSSTGALTKRLLVVDDSDMNRMILITMIKKILEKDTFIIDVAVNGLDAVTMVTNPGAPHYDIIFMDINMPVMDGWTACEKIQAHGITTPIIINTANKISTSEAEKLQQSGVSGALSKPFSKANIQELFAKFHIL